MKTLSLPSDFCSFIQIISESNLNYHSLIGRLLDNCELLSDQKVECSPEFPLIEGLYDRSVTTRTKNFMKELKEFSQLKRNSEYGGERYIQRLKKYSDIRESTFLHAAYLFTNVLFSPEVQMVTKKMSLKIFSACLNISQKLLMEKVWKMEDFKNLVGFKAADIAKLEDLLLVNVFRFRLTHCSETIHEYQKWLLQLNSRIQYCKQIKLSKENQQLNSFNSSRSITRSNKARFLSKRRFISSSKHIQTKNVIKSKDFVISELNSNKNGLRGSRLPFVRYGNKMKKRNSSRLIK